MARYIDAEPMLREAIEERKFVFAAEDRFKNEIIVRTVYNDLAEFIDKQPTADVEKVRHGEWIVDGDITECSNCHKEYVTARGMLQLNEFDYCPNCGAKMDGTPPEEAQ